MVDADSCEAWKVHKVETMQLRVDDGTTQTSELASMVKDDALRDASVTVGGFFHLVSIPIVQHMRSTIPRT